MYRHCCRPCSNTSATATCIPRRSSATACVWTTHRRATPCSTKTRGLPQGRPAPMSHRGAAVQSSRRRPRRIRTGAFLGGDAFRRLAVLLAHVLVALTQFAKGIGVQVVQTEQRIVGTSVLRNSSSILICSASVSRFWVFWMRKTMRKVTMVVEVLITSCQVSLKSKSGPLIAHNRINPRATTKVGGRPAQLDRRWAKRENSWRRTPAAFSLLDDRPPAGLPTTGRMTGALRAPATSGGTTGFAGARYVGDRPGRIPVAPRSPGRACPARDVASARRGSAGCFLSRVFRAWRSSRGSLPCLHAKEPGVEVGLARRRRASALKALCRQPRQRPGPHLSADRSWGRSGSAIRRNTSCSVSDRFTLAVPSLHPGPAVAPPRIPSHHPRSRNRACRPAARHVQVTPGELRHPLQLALREVRLDRVQGLFEGKLVRQLAGHEEGQRILMPGSSVRLISRS